MQDPLAEAIGSSPGVAQQKALGKQLNSSPRVVAQRALSEQLNTKSSRVVQREAQQPEAPSVIQRADDDDFEGYDDYDDDYEEDDAADPDLAQYMKVPDRPTLGDYLEPVLAEEKRKEANAERRKRQMEKSKRRKPAREKRRDADVQEHGERRELNIDAGKLVELVGAAELDLSGANSGARTAILRLGDKKGRAGTCKVYIEDGDPNTIWEARKEAINSLASALEQQVIAGTKVLVALRAPGPYANLAVPTDELKKKIAQMKTFLQDCVAPLQELQRLQPEVTAQLKWMDELIAKKKGTGAAPEILYPNVRIHKIVKGCPFFDNIPFDELNAQTATGTHGKSGHGAFVHKKVAGGFAITFGYVGGLAYVIDWGPKAPNSQKYDYKRGGVASDSGAGIGEAKDQLQV